MFESGSLHLTDKEVEAFNIVIKETSNTDAGIGQSIMFGNGLCCLIDVSISVLGKFLLQGRYDSEAEVHPYTVSISSSSSIYSINHSCFSPLIPYMRLFTSVW